MADGLPARLTVDEGRRFGLTVGAAFVVLAIVLQLRGKPSGALVSVAVGTALVVAALAVPTRLGPLERAWMGLAHAISRVTTPILMGIIYFAVITPMGFVRRITGNSPLWPRRRGESRWEQHVSDADRGKSMERQF